MTDRIKENVIDREVEAEQVRVRMEKWERLQSSPGFSPYPNTYCPSHTSAILHQHYASKTKEELAELREICSVAGRVMAIRDFGKAAFLRLQDRGGTIQLFVQKGHVSDADYALYRDLDIGDIVYCSGEVFRTKTAELSVHVTQLVLLVKSLRPLPEKYHGLADIEVKYRQRYLDLIMSEETRRTFQVRSHLIQELRSFLLQEDFLEVETPMMHPVAGGANARPFVTHHHALDMTLFMRIAPELYLKRLVVGGFERVFEINRNFRNEGISIKHNPEFTMVEFYQAYATYEDLMDFFPRLFVALAKKVLGTTELVYQEASIELDVPWKRVSLEEAILEYSRFQDRKHLRDPQALLHYCHTHQIPTQNRHQVGELLMSIFEHEVEAQLIQPTFVTHYPLHVSPLARKNAKDPFVVDRFELYIYGREMANAFSELNDPMDQKARFEEQALAKKAGNEEAFDMDLDYITALEYGLPPTAGAGIGIDRLAMLFSASPSIRDVILFPLMRPVGG